MNIFDKSAIAAAAMAVLTTLPAAAEEQAGIMRLPSDADVATTADRLVTAIEGAGAKVMARIDHGAGAQQAGMDIGASQLVVFGNPVAGTPVMVENRLAGLMLPLKVLVYEDTDGKVWVAYEDIAGRLGALEGLEGAEVSKPLAGALDKLGKVAAGTPG